MTDTAAIALLFTGLGLALYSLFGAMYAVAVRLPFKRPYTYWIIPPGVIGCLLLALVAVTA